MTFSKYYYLTDIKGSVKGIIGELLFKNSRDHIYSTKICSPNILERLPFHIPVSTIKFLTNNWFTLDCFKFNVAKNLDTYIYVNTLLYEVKMTNNYTLHNRPKFYDRMKFTDNQKKVYEEARTLGLDVKVVKIVLYMDGKYTINIMDYDNEKYRYIICNGSENFQKKSAIFLE